MNDFDIDSYFRGYVDGSTEPHSRRNSQPMGDGARNVICIVLLIIWFIDLFV